MAEESPASERLPTHAESHEVSMKMPASAVHGRRASADRELPHERRADQLRRRPAVRPGLPPLRSAVAGGDWTCCPSAAWIRLWKPAWIRQFPLVVVVLDGVWAARENPLEASWWPSW